MPCLPLALVLLLAAPGDGIAWSPSLEEALVRAKSEQRVVLLAVNMDGEAANDRMAEQAYRERALVELSKETINVLASSATHAAAGQPCPRFPGLTCAQHQTCEEEARRSLLKANARGFVVSPQHVLLAPEGTVLLSVAYELAPEELLWCLATARQRAFPDKKLALPAAARMPVGVRLARVAPADEGGAPPTRTEVEELIRALEKERGGAQRLEKLLRLALSDEPDAVKFLALEMKAAPGGGRNARGGGGNADTPRLQRLLAVLGARGPRAHVPLLCDFLTQLDPTLRGEAAVALEQLAAPEAVKALQKALADEEDALVQDRLVRALGSSGAREAKVRALLLRRLASEKRAAGRVALYLALGHAQDAPEVAELLARTLRDGPLPDASAAGAALAFSLAEPWRARLEALRAGLAPERLPILDSTLAVLAGGSLEPLLRWIATATGDPLPRPRFFDGG